jgi:hypothetical protein
MANRNNPDYTPADQRDSVDEERIRSGVEDPTDLADDTGDEFEDEDNEDLDEETGEGEDTF